MPASTLAPKVPARWNKLAPTSLRHALELCKDYAREVRNLSVERIADEMGVTDHWSLYKWMQNGRMPVNLVRPFESACGINYVSRWIATSGGKLLVDLAGGRLHGPDDMVTLNTSFSEALQLLSDFYAAGGKGDPKATLDAINHHLQQCCYHRNNVAACAQPELELL